MSSNQKNPPKTFTYKGAGAAAASAQMQSSATVVHRERWTYEQLRAAKTIDAMPPVVAAIEALAEAKRAESDAEAAYASALADARVQGTRSQARRAQRALEDARDAEQDSHDVVANAQRGIATARRDAFAIAAPLIRAEHLCVLETQLAPALHALEALGDTLAAIESVAGSFCVAGGASLAPAKSPIVGEVGDMLRERARQFLRVLEAHRPAANS